MGRHKVNRWIGGEENDVFTAISSLNRIIFSLVIFSFFIALLMLVGPLYMLQVYDRVLSSGSLPTLSALTVMVAVLFTALGLLEWLRSCILAGVASRFEDRLSQRSFHISIKQAVIHPDTLDVRAYDLLRNLRRFLASPALGAFLDAPWSILFFIALFMLHWVFGLWAVFGAGMLLVLAFANQMVTRKSSAISDQREREARGLAQEACHNVDVAVAMGMTSTLMRRWHVRSSEADAENLRFSYSASGFVSGTRAFRLFLQSSILGLGAWLVIIGQSTPGAMIAASILMGRAIAPLEQCVGQWRMITSAFDSWVMLSRLFRTYPVEEARMPLPPFAGNIIVDSLSAKIPDTDQFCVKDISFSMRPGQTLGVIGHSASGKTSLAKVLVGIWGPVSGSVRLDGAELATWSPESIGSQIGYMPQRVDLFCGTIRENIARFNSEASPDAIIKAAIMAGCHQMILQLPKGYDTEIGMEGFHLSAGQRQRVGLARALFGSPKLVVLDEPDANLDQAGEHALHRAISALKKQKTTLVLISHRAALLPQCDFLLVLDHGGQKVFGSHEEVTKWISEARSQPRKSTHYLSRGGTHE